MHPHLIPSGPGDTVDRRASRIVRRWAVDRGAEGAVAQPEVPGYQFPADVKAEIDRLVDLHLERVERRFTWA